ncbi:MAG: phosphoglycerate dehydrogenase, partial [Alphaproteobacteria bacterium]|nr:phosphoglycerate dehydrogenase [Alphaproteobacteria bacterium]
MPKVLIADKMDRCAEEIFTRKGISFDIKTGLSSEQIADIITDYDAVACRSSAKITKDVLQKAKNLKVIGRAGIGVDT